MKDAWKELPSASEAEPLVPAKKGKAYGDSEADGLTGFTTREISQQAIRAWLIFQAAGFLFQFLLWQEVSLHLADFEDVVARECGPQHRVHGVCAGPSWNTSKFEDFQLAGAERHTFSFTTKSNPPTFLLAVDPLTQAQAGAVLPSGEMDEDLPDLKSPWTAEVRRINPRQTVPLMKIYHHMGREVVTVQDASAEAVQSMMEHGYVEWEAHVQGIGSRKERTRFVSFVEDAASRQLLAMHGNDQCSFSKAWKAFNLQHEGHSHQALSRCKFLLGLVLFVGAGAVKFVHDELWRRDDSFGKGRVHAVVMAKFVLQDIPQQICVVLYLFGWYEAAGLRCQLCLFDPHHCGSENAFHFTNFVAIGCILLSACANQLLIRPVRKRSYTEDDVCMQYWIRIGGVSVATLPFTTGCCFASRSVLPEPTFFHLLFALPCAVGWMSISGFGCIGTLLCCEDSDFDF